MPSAIIYTYPTTFWLLQCSVFGMACLDRWERNRLQKPQNRVVRVITKWSYNTNLCYLFRSALSWDNLSVRRVKQKTNLIYKCFNKLASVYLCNMFIPRALSFALRQKLYQPKRFSYSGASLSENSSRGCSHCKNSSPLDIFKKSRNKCFSASDSPTWQICKPVNKINFTCDVFLLFYYCHTRD